jgi:hypothetical protein
MEAGSGTGVATNEAEYVIPCNPVVASIARTWGMVPLIAVWVEKMLVVGELPVAAVPV